MNEIIKKTEAPKRKPLRKAILIGVRAAEIGTGMSGLRMISNDTEYISFGGITSRIAKDSELHAFMQDLKLSDSLEITIRKVKS